MAVRGIAGDEDAADPVAVRDREAQIPEADMLELDVELSAGGLVQRRRKSKLSVVVPAGTGAWKNQVLPRSTRPKNFQ